MGSDPYLSPEVFYQSYYEANKADVWSLAIVFCCILIHQFPWRIPKPKEDKSYNYFTMKNRELVDEKGRKKIVGPQRVLNKLPEESRSLIHGMLELIPENRMTIFDVQKNQFFQSIEFCHLEDGSDKEDPDVIQSKGHEHHLITRQDFDEGETPPPPAEHVSAPPPSTPVTTNIKKDEATEPQPVLEDNEQTKEVTVPSISINQVE